MGTYLTHKTDLESALSVATVLALYDDGSGTVNDASLTEVEAEAEAEAEGFLVGRVQLPLTNPTLDKLMKRAVIDFAVAFSFEKHPEYVRTHGEDPRASGRYERAVARMVRIQEAVQLLPTQGTPLNVGGTVRPSCVRMFTSEDGAAGMKDASGDY